MNDTSMDTICNELREISKQYEIKFITAKQAYSPNNNFHPCYNNNNSIVIIDYLTKLS